MAWNVVLQGSLSATDSTISPPAGAMTVAGAVTSILAARVIVPAAAAIALIGSAPSLGGPKFDYYISPTGSDANAGTLAAPWAITSLCRPTINANNVANRNALKGKRVGLLPGVYAIYASLWSQAATYGFDYSNPPLAIPSGASTTGRTFVGASDSSGNQTVGWASLGGGLYSYTHAITASPSGTPDGGPPGTTSSSIPIIGYDPRDAVGHVQVDGLALCDSTNLIVSFYGNATNLSQSGAITDCWVTNCHVFNCAGNEGNNTGAVWFGGGAGNGGVQNCVIHNAQISANFTASISGTTMTVTALSSGNLQVGQTISGAGVTSCTISAYGTGKGGSANSAIGTYTVSVSQAVGSTAITSNAGTLHNCAGIFSEASLSNLYEYNTIYDCNVAIYDKNQGNGGNTYRYNYLEVNGCDPYDILLDCCGAPSGYTALVYNNVMVIAPNTGGERAFWNGICTDGPGSQPNQAMQFYNNTCYVLSGGGVQMGVTYQSAGPGSVTHYNNIYCMAAPGFYDTVSFNSGAGAVALSDYNAYVGGCGGGDYFGTGTNGAPATNYTLANWQASLALDVHSFAQASESGVFSSPGGARNPGGYKLAAGSPCLGAGRVGGLSSGSSVDQGAWGGTDVNTGVAIAQIGSNL